MIFPTEPARTTDPSSNARLTAQVRTLFNSGCRSQLLIDQQVVRSISWTGGWKPLFLRVNNKYINSSHVFALLTVPKRANHMAHIFPFSFIKEAIRIVDPWSVLLKLFNFHLTLDSWFKLRMTFSKLYLQSHLKTAISHGQIAGIHFSKRSIYLS